MILRCNGIIKLMKFLIISLALIIALFWFVLSQAPDETPQALEPPQESSPNIDFEAIERQVFNLINEQREARGILIFFQDKNLQNQTRKHSEWMASSGNFDHSDLKILENIYILEDVYWGININPEELSKSIFNTWMGSPLHKDNILDPTISSGAVGIAENQTARSVYATFMAR